MVSRLETFAAAQERRAADLLDSARLFDHEICTAKSEPNYCSHRDCYSPTPSWTGQPGLLFQVGLASQASPTWSSKSQSLPDLAATTRSRDRALFLDWEWQRGLVSVLNKLQHARAFTTASQPAQTADSCAAAGEVGGSGASVLAAEALRKGVPQLFLRRCRILWRCKLVAERGWPA